MKLTKIIIEIMKPNHILPGILLLITSLSAQAALVINSNTLDLTVTTTYSNQASLYNTIQDDDTFESRFDAGLASVTYSGSNAGGVEFGSANNVVSGTSTNTAAKNSANPGNFFMDFDTAGTTLGFDITDITLYTNRATDNRRDWRFVFAYSTDTAPTTFIDFLDVRDFAVASGFGTRLSITGFDGQLPNVDTIRVSSFARDGINHAIINEIDINVIPEPTSGLLVALGALTMAMRRRRSVR